MRLHSPSKAKTRRDKVILLGQSATGKTCLSNRIIQDSFNEMTRSTVGPACLSKTLEYNGITMRLDIWDTGGSERYRSIAPMYYHDAAAAVVVFDVTRPETLTDAIHWVDNFKQHTTGDVIIGLAANQIDRLEERKVFMDDLEDFECDFIVETSAKTGEGIEQLCCDLCAHLVLHPPRMPLEDQLPVMVPPPTGRCAC